MKKILTILLGLSILVSCQDVTDKAKSILKKDLQKADSLTAIATDSIKNQLQGTNQDQYKEQTQQQSKLSEKQLQKLFSGTYSSMMKAIRANDSLVLRQFCYFGDSLVALENRGIFQVVVEEPIEILFGYSTPEDTKGYECQLQFKKFPELTEIGWTEEGCFVQRTQNFHDFSAVIDISKQANLEIPANIEKKVNTFEQKVYFEVLNTYFGIIYYFVLDNNKFYLAAVDLNSTEEL